MIVSQKPKSSVKSQQFPWFETANTETRTSVNPLGVKGVGEAGTISSTPAIVNSVVGALSPFGVRHSDMTLNQGKIWNILKQGAKPEDTRHDS